ncbi:hypothetical protein Y032_0081g1442 [Ancylostoma ceylanicum]|uniref:Uncharacterized protein n=1 Tax=Ancylostoma ceylanicum TaxID=53326 RepID=A0A016TS55_9BILA|nr:hypothetical protein Y032_0081g1442 [Ancylostoma ceylanicum]
MDPTQLLPRFQIHIIHSASHMKNALWLAASPPEAAGNHDVSVFLPVSAQQARCVGAADDQSARAAIPPLVYGRLQFTVIASFFREQVHSTTTCMLVAFQVCEKLVMFVIIGTLTWLR